MKSASSRWRPVRRGPARLSRAYAVALSLVGLAMMTSPAVADSTPPGTAAQVATLVAASTSITSLTAAVRAELPGAPSDIADRVYHIASVCDTATTCVYGDTSATTTVVLFGNSHARMWLPAIDPIATADDLKIVVLGKNECPVVSLKLPPRRFPGCTTMTQTAVTVINHLKPSVVILADRTVSTGFSQSVWRTGMITTIKSIAPSGARVVILGDIQEFATAPVQCVAAHPTKVQNCSMANPNPAEPGVWSAELSAANATKSTYVNPNRWLCTAHRCSPIIGNVVAYWDNDHVSVTYARYLSTVMGDALQPTLTHS